MRVRCISAPRLALGGLSERSHHPRARAAAPRSDGEDGDAEGVAPPRAYRSARGDEDQHGVGGIGPSVLSGESAWSENPTHTTTPRTHQPAGGNGWARSAVAAATRLAAIVRPVDADQSCLWSVSVYDGPGPGPMFQ